MDRLTRDSIAAQRAGMTYGKWKMLHPHTEEADLPDEIKVPRKKEEKPRQVKLCKICGKPIINSRTKGSGSQKRLYCSRECAYEAIKMHERERYRKKGDKANGKI